MDRATKTLDTSRPSTLSDVLTEGITTIRMVEDFEWLVAAMPRGMRELSKYIQQDGKFLFENFHFENNEPALALLMGFLGMVNTSFRKPGWCTIKTCTFADAVRINKVGFNYVTFDRAKLSRAILSYTDLSDADLSGADLINADMIGTTLKRTNLSGADLSGADLGGSRLHGTNLNGANLMDAILVDTDWKNVQLARTIVFGADLSMATWLTEELKASFRTRWAIID